VIVEERVVPLQLVSFEFFTVTEPMEMLQTSVMESDSLRGVRDVDWEICLLVRERVFDVKFGITEKKVCAWLKKRYGWGKSGSKSWQTTYRFQFVSETVKCQEDGRPLGVARRR
jgi:hypothetical protein